MQNFTEVNDLNLTDNVDELKKLVNELSKKNKILAADNADFGEKNLRLHKARSLR